MTAEQLAKQCRDAQAQMGPDAEITLVLPWVSRGLKTRINRTRGPWGYVAGTSDTTTTAFFKAREVLAALLPEAPR